MVPCCCVSCSCVSKKICESVTTAAAPMDTSTGEKYTWLYPTNTGRTVTEIKSNVRTFEIKISTDLVTIPFFPFGDACAPCRHWRRWKKGAMNTAIWLCPATAATSRKGCAWETHLHVLLLQQTVVLFEVRAPAPLVAQLLFSRVAQGLEAVQVLSQLLHFPVMLAVRLLSRC